MATVTEQPTIQIPEPKQPVVTTQTESAAEEAEEQTLQALAEESSSKTGFFQSIANFGEAAFTDIVGLIANIASYKTDEKIDYDKDGMPIVNGIGKTTRNYRSSANLRDAEDLKAAIERQREALKREREDQTDGLDTSFLKKDFIRILNVADAALKQRIFGPLWETWTSGEDFLAAVKYVLGELVNTFDPLMDLIDDLEEYVYKTHFNNLSSMAVDLGTEKLTGEKRELPLGMIATKVMKTIINYIREIIKNVEMLATEYTVKELNILVRKGTLGVNGGTIKQAIQELIQRLINCIRPYVQNLIIAIILDAIDEVVSKLKQLGLLDAAGPLKLIPTAITVLRALMNGDLEAIEEMAMQTLTKMINLLQLSIIAARDPSILWADVDRLDREIAIARYDELAKGGMTEEELNEFFEYEDKSYSASVRHFLQRMKLNSSDWSKNIAKFVTTLNDDRVLYKLLIAKKTAKQNLDSINQLKQEEQSARMDKARESILECALEPDLFE